MSRVATHANSALLVALVSANLKLTSVGICVSLTKSLLKARTSKQIRLKSGSKTSKATTWNRGVI